jgi:hypothetical protein
MFNTDMQRLYKAQHNFTSFVIFISWAGWQLCLGPGSFKKKIFFVIYTLKKQGNSSLPKWIF